jgi:2-keto-4-pentenoate hydratase/2-oxohepta-3-ene-1,7-dioic acid hydratase in catechol pathway
VKLVRFGEAGQERPGVLDQQGRVRDASSRVSDWTGEALDPAWLAKFGAADIATLPQAPAGVRLGPPILSPGKMICIGLNYADHAAETGFELPREPLVFFKSPTALSGPTDPIKIPMTADAVDWEVELACIIGRQATNIMEERAMEVVAGFAVANDVTERTWQFHRGGQWSKAKSADTFAPLGPWLVTPDETMHLGDRRIWLRKNDSATRVGAGPDDLHCAADHRPLERVHAPRAGRRDSNGHAPRCGLQQARPRLSAAGRRTALRDRGIGRAAHGDRGLLSLGEEHHMYDVIDCSAGSYRFIKGSMAYSLGVAALPGFRLERVRFQSPIPLEDAFRRIAGIIADAKRPASALAACELRSPGQFTEASFATFNERYLSLVRGIGFSGIIDANPITRTNVCPSNYALADTSVYAFSYTVDDSAARPSFVLAGAVDFMEGDKNFRNLIVALDQVDLAGIRKKAAHALRELDRRLALFGSDWSKTTGNGLYCIHDVYEALIGEMAARGAAHAGITWHLCQPPIGGLEFEMDARSIWVERTV